MASSVLRRAALGALSVALVTLVACSSGSSDGAATTTSAVKGSTTTVASASGGTKGSGSASGSGKPLARYADYQTVNYADPAHWVCRPDKADDICDSDLDATVVEADGTLTVEPFKKAANPPIDCFYVYPTISRDKTATSDWNFSNDEEGYVTLNQAARLQSQCRLYVPVYRQATLTSLTSRLAGGSIAGADRADPYADVLDAFRTYMAQDNDGRGVVLIGHSQGTAMLEKLISEEIDPHPDVRKQLVSAYLAGGSIHVPPGKTVGGSFQHVPMCTSTDEAGCVVTWSTFRSTAPPPSGSYFGRPDGDLVSACVNPAAIAGGKADLDAYFPANSGASILSSLGTSTAGRSWLDAGSAKITTPFVRLPKFVSGVCATTSDRINYLSASLNPDTAGPRANDFPGDLTPEWGLHLVDINLVMGNIVDDVAAQAKAYAHP